MSKDLLRNGEVISGALLVALGVYIFLQAHAWDYTTPDGPGPGFFPVWYGIAMVVLERRSDGSQASRTHGTNCHGVAPCGESNRSSTAPYRPASGGGLGLRLQQVASRAARYMTPPRERRLCGTFASRPPSDVRCHQTRRLRAER